MSACIGIAVCPVQAPVSARGVRACQDAGMLHNTLCPLKVYTDRREGNCLGRLAHRASQAGGFRVALAGAVKVQAGLSTVKVRLAGVHARVLLLKVQGGVLQGGLDHLCFTLKALLRKVNGLSLSSPPSP